MLIVAEKYRVAASIAKALGFRTFERDHFENDKGDVICFASGHLFELTHGRDAHYAWKTPEHFDNLPNKLFSELSDRNVFVRGEYISCHEFAHSIMEHMQQAEIIVNACDMDREGERIFYELFNEADTQAQILRMDLSQGLTRRLISEAFANLKDGLPYKPRHYASQARNGADYPYSMATQVLTYYGRSGQLHPLLGNYNDSKASVVSIGSVQIPTLAMISERCKLVEKNKIRSIYQVVFTAKIGRYKLEFIYSPKLSGTSETLLAQQSLAANYAKIRKASGLCFVVTSAESHQVEVAPPAPFNTSSVQAAMTDLSPKETLEIMQSLYQKGLISYPRTDEDSLPDEKFSNGRLASLLESLDQNKGFSEKVAKDGTSLAELSRALEHSNHHSVTNTAPVNAHSAIVPTDTNASNIELTANEQAVYDAICERFVASCASGGVSTQTSISVAFEDDVLGVLGESRSYFVCNRVVGQNAGKLAKVEVGDTFDASDIMVRKVERDVPQYFALSEIPERMRTISDSFDDPRVVALLKKANGIGTPQTRGTAIESLIKRHYIELLYEGETPKAVVTSKGDALLSILPRLFRSAEIKALWECQLTDIENTLDLTLAKEKRDAFIRNSFNEIEYFCRMVNRKQVSAFTKREPASPKLQKQVTQRALLLNIDVDERIFASQQACHHFLLAHPAPYTKSAMNDLEMSGLDTDDNVMRDPVRVAIREAQKKSDKPPSPKRLTLAMKLGEKVRIKMPDKATKSARACERFIKICESKRTPSLGQVRTVKRLAKQTNFPLDNSMLRSRREVVRLINELRKKKK